MGADSVEIGLTPPRGGLSALSEPLPPRGGLSALPEPLPKVFWPI